MNHPSVTEHTGVGNADVTEMSPKPAGLMTSPPWPPWVSRARKRTPFHFPGVQSRRQRQLLRQFGQVPALDILAGRWLAGFLAQRVPLGPPDSRTPLPGTFPVGVDRGTSGAPFIGWRAANCRRPCVVRRAIWPVVGQRFFANAPNRPVFASSALGVAIWHQNRVVGWFFECGWPLLITMTIATAITTTGITTTQPEPAPITRLDVFRIESPPARGEMVVDSALRTESRGRSFRTCYLDPGRRRLSC